MRVIRLLLSACLLATLSAAFGAAEKDEGGRRDEGSAQSESASIRAILVSASNKKGEPDRRLARYESNLKRSLRFETFRYEGEGSARIAMPGGGELSLARDQRLELEAAYYGANQVWLRVRWMDGGREFMNTVLVLKRGVPAVLGGLGRGSEDETFAIIVTTT